jgi:hypothetical protein
MYLASAYFKRNFRTKFAPRVPPIFKAHAAGWRNVALACRNPKGSKMENGQDLELFNQKSIKEMRRVPVG